MVSAKSFLASSSRLGLVLASLAFGAGGAVAQPAAKLEAVYGIGYAGLNLGRANVASDVSSASYALQGGARLEFLGGIVWRLTGGSRSSGAMTENGPRPAAFSFQFENGRRTGKLDMTFRGDAVRDVVSDLPDPADHPRFVAVAPADRIGVLDPLSALFLTARASGKSVDDSVCDTRLPVFDGKHRFDLQLAHKQTVRVKPPRKRGYGGPAVICSVKYLPISGYKENQQAIEFLSRTDDIEIWLIPVAEAGVYLPYHVSVPTAYGPATATLRQLTVGRGKDARELVSD